MLVVVAERSGGRPLVAEELLAARRELPGVSLTSSFQDLVLARIAARSPEARRALRLLAPAGRPLRRTDLAAIADEFESESTSAPPRSSNAPRRGDGVLDADLTHGLDEAIEYGFIREDDDGLALRHELVGHAIEADLLPSMRIRHHMAVARALADQPFVGAHHFAVALDPVAVRHAAIAAADAAAVSTRRSTSCARSSWRSPPAQRRELLPRIGVMLQNGGAWSGVRAVEMLQHIAQPARAPAAGADAGRPARASGSCGRTAYRRLSGGQQQRLALAMAVVGRPELVFVDEPTAGMDPQARRDTWDLLAELRADGVTIVLTTHYMDEAERLADQVHVIDRGRLIASGSPSALTRAGAAPSGWWSPSPSRPPRRRRCRPRSGRAPTSRRSPRRAC